MLLHDLLHHKGCFCLIVSAQGYLTLEAQRSCNSQTPFSKHTPHQKAASKQTGNVESRKPSFRLLPAGTPPGLGAATHCVLREHDSHTFSKRNVVIWGLQK